MVDMRRPMPTALERLDFVRQQTRCATKSAFAKWINAKSAQAVATWESRNSISRNGALLVNKATNASVHWLLTDEGEPFPNGPTIYPGAGRELIEQRLIDLEDQLDVASHIVGRLIELISAKIPGAGVELEAALRLLQSNDAASSPALEVAIHAAQIGRGSKVTAGRAASRSEYGGKPPRSGR